MFCAFCGGGDKWIKTCRTKDYSRIRVCDHCYGVRVPELVIVPGDYVVTDRCDGCGAYFNPREMAEARPGGRYDTYSGTCQTCAEGGTGDPEDAIEATSRGGSTLAIRVPEEVFEGLEAVCESGAVNMLCRTDVVVKAHYLGYPATRDWVAASENFEIYARGLFEGFEAAAG
jgi:hypothetical protein